MGWIPPDPPSPCLFNTTASKAPERGRGLGTAESPPRALGTRIDGVAMAHGWISKAWDGLAGPPERDVLAPHGCWSLHERRWQEVTSGMVRGAAEVACHARAAGPARWPKAYLHVELSPRGGGLHHPVHHTDQGFALAHLRQTGKEISEVSGDARALGCRRCSSVQDPSGHRAARCHLREMSQVLEPRGNCCPRLLLPCLGQSRAS